MSTEVADPRTFRSWEDAFQYPVPAVRRMEQQLRSDISSNKERLRTLVGASYRDLLGTAGSIIEMDSQMQQVESYLATMGMKCNGRLLGRGGVNLLRLGRETGSKDRARYRVASQLSVLRACPTAISRLLRKRGFVLLAAKVLVISRLLHKKLSGDDAHHDKTFYIEAIRSKLAKLRQKLLHVIDAVFASLDAGQTVLVEAMCAFALATSSSARDILRHFHHLRAEAIMSYMRIHQSGHGVDPMLGALKLWICSIQETHAIFPKQLSLALMDLKITPLFSGSDVRGIAELDQEVYGEWIGDDIRNFTPYIRHDNLDGEAVEELSRGWASMALERYLERVYTLLADVDDYDEVVQSRKRTLVLLLTSHSHVTSVHKRQAVDSLRNATKRRLLAIAQKRCSTLEHVTQSIRVTLQAWVKDPPDTSLDLWDKSLISLDTFHEAPAFIDAVKSRLHGASSASKQVYQQYQAWLQGIRDFEDIIEKMRSTGWEEEDDDDMVINLDDDSLDDLDARQHLLSVVDPDDLYKGLESLTGVATSNMQAAFDEMVLRLEDPDAATKAAFMLRLLRDSLTTASINVNVPLPALYCSPTSVIRLYDILTTRVTRSSLQTCGSSVMRHMAMQGPPQRALWEGNPELPVLPSPWTFRVLQSLVKEMGSLGIDVWSKEAVKEVKTFTRKEIGGLIARLFDEEFRRQRSEQPDGEKEVSFKAEDKQDSKEAEASEDPSGPAPDIKSSIKDATGTKEANDRSIQLVFDMAYILQATRSPKIKSPDHAHEEAIIGEQTAEVDALSSVHAKILSELFLGSEEKERIESGAADYWKRTSLLFALLG